MFDEAPLLLYRSSISELPMRVTIVAPQLEMEKAFVR